jgi:polysaccharide export outer membrane protein
MNERSALRNQRPALSVKRTSSKHTQPTNMHKPTLLSLSLFALFITLFSSCLSYKDIVNFQDGKSLGAGAVDSIINKHEVRLKTDDIVQVIVTSYAREESERFNLMNTQQVGQMAGQQGGGQSIADPYGYRVDSKGNIELPVVGNIQVTGLTMEECRDVIYNKIYKTGYLKDLAVQVRFLSFRISILGEVTSPGTYTIAAQKVTVLEALGLAHDVTLFSQRDNILVIREKEGQRLYGRVNLKSKELFQSDYFYLQPNDIIYVEPHKSKILSAPDPASRYISTVIAFVSLMFLILK